MDLLLVAGVVNNIFYSKTIYKKRIINRQVIFTSQLMGVIEDKHIRFNAIVILDEGIDQSLEDVEKVIQQVRILYHDIPIIFITRSLELKSRYKDADIYYQDKIRLSSQLYDEIFKHILETKEKGNKEVHKNIAIGKGNANLSDLTGEESREVGLEKEKISIFSRFKRNKKKEGEEAEEDNQFKYISKGISRVISITGHRGVGVTSTLVNLGYEAAQKNLNTIIVDLDINNRTTNLYFGEFIRQVDKDEHLSGSLLKCLAKPQDYKHSACYISNKLWIAGLAYDFQDDRLIHQFYNSDKLVNMLTVLRQHFNVILLDMPFEILERFQESIPNIDSFALCSNNSQYSIITTLRNMDNYLSNENIGYVNAKSKLVITKYNDRAQYDDEFFTPDKVSDIFASDLCEELSIRMPIAGYVRYNEAFDNQIEDDIPITGSNRAFKESYSNILLRMIEGVN